MSAFSWPPRPRRPTSPPDSPAHSPLEGGRRYSSEKGKGTHRRRREPAPWPGMLLHQDGSTHEWVPGAVWDLIVTMDDATNEHHSMFFCDEEGVLKPDRSIC